MEMINLLENLNMSKLMHQTEENIQETREISY